MIDKSHWLLNFNISAKLSYIVTCKLLNDNCFWQSQNHGDIAQLARAPALQAGGPGFESLCLHHPPSLSDDSYGGCPTKPWRSRTFTNY